jgi:hypothetical protein
MSGVATAGEAEGSLGVTRLNEIAGYFGPICTERLAWCLAMIFNRSDVGWHLGRARIQGWELWVPWDRTAGVIGPESAERHRSSNQLFATLTGFRWGELVAVRRCDLGIDLPARDGSEIARSRMRCSSGSNANSRRWCR